MAVDDNPAMPAATVRRAVPDDATAIAGLFARSRAVAMPWLPVLHSPDEDVEFFRGEVSRGIAWVALNGEALAGFAVVDDDWLRHLYVEPDGRGSGVGSTLLAVSIEHGARQLWVFERNAAAREFYRHRGFVDMERTDGSANEERLPDVRMELASG